MHTISVITTGGTIGSVLGGDSVQIAESEDRVAKEIKQAQTQLGCSVVLSSPLNKNSENFAPEDWLTLIKAIDAENQSQSKAIVITHGSDTLAYSLAAAVIYQNRWQKKVCFTGSFYAPDHPDSDAAINLLASLAFASDELELNGVYAAFRSDDSNNSASIMAGNTVKPMAFDDSYFHSLYNETTAEYSHTSGFIYTSNRSTTLSAPTLDNEVLPTKENLNDVKSKIVKIAIYPGMDIAMLRTLCKDKTVLILELYHSGTGPVSESELISFIREYSPSTLILMGSFPTKHISLPYSSTHDLRDAGAYIYADIQTHYLYVFCLLALASSVSPPELIKKLAPFEFLPVN